MKFYIFLVTLLLASVACFAQPASTGINTIAPNPKAALHINTSAGSSQGLIIPRLTTAERPAFNPLTNAESGLMFYNTDVDSIFYWTGLRWVSLSINTVSSPTNFWNLSGNNADSALHYLGTSVAQPIVIKTNNIERMRIGRGGNVGIGMNPSGNTLLTLKTPGSGRALQVSRSTTTDPIFEVNEKGGGGFMTLFDNTASPNVFFSSIDDSYIFSHNLGIGVTSSTAKLEVRGISDIGSELALRLTNSAAKTLFYVTNAGDVVIPPFAPTAGVVVSDVSGRLSVAPGTPVVGSGIASKVAFWQNANTLSANSNLHWDNAGGGYLGVGTTTPHGRLQFSNEINNRKIVLYETANDNNQYYGFGINGSTLRYQTDAVGADHVFYAASAGTSVELMRIKGTGLVGIGMAPDAGIAVARGTGVNGTAHFKGTAHDSHFNYSTGEGTYIRGGIDGAPIYLNDAHSGSVNVGSTATTTQLYVGVGNQSTPIAISSSSTWGTAISISNTSSGGSVHSIVSAGSAHTGNPALPAGSFAISDLSGNHAMYMMGGGAPNQGSIVLAQNPAQRIGIGSLPNSLDKFHIRGADQAWNIYSYNTYSAGTSYGISTSVSNSSTSTAYGVYGYAFSSGGTEYGVYCSGNGAYTGTWLDVSDAKFKTNIQDYKGALKKVLLLSPKTYTMKQDSSYSHMGFNNRLEIGLISQEVEQVLPELVEDGAHPAKRGEDGKPMGEEIKYKAMNYIGLTPVLVQAIKEQQQIIDQQKLAIDSVNTKFQNMASANEKLLKEVEEIKKHLGMDINAFNTKPAKKNKSRIF